ncbi:MAG: BrnT family toxin [Burkholderiales bacterium]
MKSRLTWKEQKRAKNLDKHHLDFADAGLVLDSQFRLDVESVRNNEERTQSFA